MHEQWLRGIIYRDPRTCAIHACELPILSSKDILSLHISLVDGQLLEMLLASQHTRRDDDTASVAASGHDHEWHLAFVPMIERWLAQAAHRQGSGWTIVRKVATIGWWRSGKRAGCRSTPRQPERLDLGVGANAMRKLEYMYRLYGKWSDHRGEDKGRRVWFEMLGKLIRGLIRKLQLKRVHKVEGEPRATPVWHDEAAACKSCDCLPGGSAPGCERCEFLWTCARAHSMSKR